MSEQQFASFWSNRPIRLVGSFPLQSWKENREKVLLQREQMVFEKRRTFFSEWSISEDTISDCDALKTGNCLRLWAIHKSWTFCSKCNLLHTVNLVPSFRRLSRPTNISTCPCTKDRYIIPQFLQIPLCLRQLTKEDVIALRPFDLHSGNYQRMQHGYRVKDGFSRVSWSKKSVMEKICELNDSSRIRCLLAYRYLTTTSTSSYKHFLDIREGHISTGKEVNLYDYRENKGIECALWPHLYPVTEWCETILSGNATRKSSKVSFTFKLLSEIVDYSLDYELLQFHYDRWLFNTVSGAISSCRGTLRSPATSLDGKPFSIEYWRWQHRFLLDAVKQFGYPSVFITISPYEWTFPQAQWLASIAEMLGKLPTELACLETLHIVHLLEQTVKGYLCGSNTNRWKDHFFCSGTENGPSNVLNYFYRVEFPSRGTAHLHLLIWLKDLDQLDVNTLRADLPSEDANLAYLVYDLQRSHKTVLDVNTEQTHFSSDNKGNKRLRLYYPMEAFTLNLRAYLSSILPFLKCSMDAQTTDNKGMIMRYVTSYVSKFKDSQSRDSLYCTNVSPALAAYRHLADMKPCEPEMVMTLSSLKLTSTQKITKRYIPPRPGKASDCPILKKYQQRDKTMDITFLEYLRMYQTNNVSPTVYKGGKALVGVKYVSYFNVQFFFQFLLMNKAHFSLDDIKHPHHTVLPEDLQYFSACMVHLPHVFGDGGSFCDLIKSEGHKDYFVDNVLSFIQSLRDIYHLWQMQVLRNDDFIGTPVTSEDCALNVRQQLVLSTLKSFMALRDRYYGMSSLSDVASEQGDSDRVTSAVSDDNEQLHAHHDSPDQSGTSEQIVQPFCTEWNRVITILGKPGTGKTKCMHACISYFISRGRRCLVATPTGYLASTYRSVFGNDIDCETVHASFCVPIDNSSPKVNWSLSCYDIIFMDEVSMVPLTIFDHIISTLKQLSTRPVLVVCGDSHQQQPISTTEKGTTQVANIFSSPHFARISVKHTLIDQFRCSDPQFYDILNQLRHFPPNVSILETLHAGGRLLCQSYDVTDEFLLETVRSYPTATFITVSKAASRRINNVVCNNMFPESHLLGTIPFDSQDAPGAVYRGMRVIISENRNKSLGVVNGQPAIVKYRQGNTFILQLPNGQHVPVYPVTSPLLTSDTSSSDESPLRTYYPFVPGYSLTICKCQGQTLASVIIWFDCDTLGEGSAYVALSRVKTFNDIRFLTPLKSTHFKAVRLETFPGNNENVIHGT